MSLHDFQPMPYHNHPQEWLAREIMDGRLQVTDVQTNLIHRDGMVTTEITLKANHLRAPAEISIHKRDGVDVHYKSLDWLRNTVEAARR